MIERCDLYEKKNAHTSKFYKKTENNSYVQVCTICRFKRLSIKVNLDMESKMTNMTSFFLSSPRYDFLCESNVKRLFDN